MRAAALIFALATTTLGGCRHRTASPGSPDARTASSTMPATTQSTAAAGPSRRYESHSFSTDVPADWKEFKDPQSVLALKGPNNVELDLAIPHLPPHVPGIIPLPAVQSGYVDDVKKRMSNVKLVESTAPGVCGAPSRRFAIEGTDKGTAKKLLVYAIVKGDHLYVVTGEGPADQFDKLVSVVNRVADSWKWTK
jgi:hypothetical protein